MGTAVVCVNYDSSEYVSELIKSLQAEEITEIVVWDNFSSQKERDRLRILALEWPSVRVVHHDRNIGFGAGVNGAIAALRSNADYIWILNPDVTVEGGALQRLTESARINGADLISPLILTGESDEIWYAGGDVFPSQGRSVHRGIGNDRRALRREGFEPVSFITGAALLISREAWDRLGGFDERFFLYCEDADLSLRSIRHQLHMGVELSAVVRHSEGASSGGNQEAKSATFYFYVQRNRINLYSPFSSKVGVVLLDGFIETLRLVVHPVWPPRRGAITRLRASLAGLLSGLRGEFGPRQ